MTEAGYEERRNSFHGIANRQVSGPPNNINASEGNNDQKLVLGPRVLRICLLVRKHCASNGHRIDDLVVTGYHDKRELHGKAEIRTCQRAEIMKGLNSSAAEMRLVGGRLCLDFVNTVDGRKNDSSQRKSQPLNSLLLGDKLKDYSDLVAWSQHSGIVTVAEAARLIKEGGQKPAAANTVLQRAIALREALHHIFRATVMKSAPPSVDLETVNDELMRARKNERLISTDNGFQWKWRGGETALDRMLWSIAQSAAEFFITGDLSRLRECGGEECGWLFEDTSRNRSRQWCHMQDCGNLAKVRRFRTRMRSSSKTNRRLTAKKRGRRN